MEFIDLMNLAQAKNKEIGLPGLQLQFSHLSGGMKVGVFKAPPDTWDGKLANLPADTWVTLYEAKSYEDAADWIRGATRESIREELARERKPVNRFRKQKWIGVGLTINAGVNLLPALVLLTGGTIPVGNYVISGLALTFLGWAIWNDRNPPRA